MKRFALAGCAALLFCLWPVHGAWAFGVKDVVQMHADGIADSLIIQKIEHSGKSFDLNAKDLHQLKEAEVSDEIISAMLQTEDADWRYDDNGYYYPPRVYVGLGFGYYHDYWPYYGGYWPYYGYYGHYGHYGRYYGGHYGYTAPRYYNYRYYGHGGYSGYYQRPYGGYSHPGTGSGATQRYRGSVGPSTKQR